MSLCGKCRLEGNHTTHTCSVDMQTFYCVWCIWKKTENAIPRDINISSLTPFHEIEWDGIYATEVAQMKVGEHWNRIHDADLTYPIIVMEHNKQLEVIDGAHRLAKSHILKRKTVACVKVTPEMLVDCRVIDTTYDTSLE